MHFLTTKLRPAVKFNPACAEHREQYAKFLETNTWAHCPYRFFLDEDQSNNNLLYAIQRELLNYYTSQEFGVDLETIKQNQRRVRLTPADAFDVV